MSSQQKAPFKVVHSCRDPVAFPRPDFRWLFMFWRNAEVKAAQVQSSDPLPGWTSSNSITFLFMNITLMNLLCTDFTACASKLDGSSRHDSRLLPSLSDAYSCNKFVLCQACKKANSEGWRQRWIRCGVQMGRHTTVNSRVAYYSAYWFWSCRVRMCIGYNKRLR